MTITPGTTYHPETALLMARLCGLVYPLPGESEWTWESRFRYHLPELVTVERVEIVADDHDLAMVIEDAHSRIVIVRGTNDAVDWIKTNFHVGFDSHHWGRVHKGFWASAYRIAQGMYNKHLPGKPTIVTGHSLGGAIATILGGLLMNVTGVYSFGSPRAFDAAGVKSWQVEHHRHHCYGDLAPHTPCLIRGYRHHGRPIYLDRAGEMHAEPGLLYRLQQTAGAWWRDLAWLAVAVHEDKFISNPVSLLGRLIHIFGSKYHRIEHYGDLLAKNVQRLKGGAA